jgi:hypothetical protein
MMTTAAMKTQVRRPAPSSLNLWSRGRRGDRSGAAAVVRVDRFGFQASGKTGSVVGLYFHTDGFGFHDRE